MDKNNITKEELEGLIVNTFNKHYHLQVRGRNNGTIGLYKIPTSTRAYLVMSQNVVVDYIKKGYYTIVSEPVSKENSYLIC